MYVGSTSPPSMQVAIAWAGYGRASAGASVFAHYREDFAQCVRRPIGNRIRLTDRGQIVEHKKNGRNENY